MLTLCLYSLLLPPQTDRKRDWAGLRLALGKVLSAAMLHKRFTGKKPSSVARLTRLMVLCACSSGKRPKTQLNTVGAVIAPAKRVAGSAHM